MDMHCNSFVRFLLLLLFISSSWICTMFAATVTHLPGFDGRLPFHLETGYVSINGETEADLFYYFVESEREPSEDPLILWLTGGPGCTGFYGLARHIGPIRVKDEPYDGTIPKFVYNPYTWTKISSIIFLDWPAISGFSFLRNDEEYIGDDLRSSNEIYNFLMQWFLDHPSFLSNSFYVVGHSYGCKTTPIVAYKIAEGIKAGEHPLINLKGYIISNPITTTTKDYNSKVPYAHGMGLISDELLQAVERSCPGESYEKPKTSACIEQIKIFNSFKDELMEINFLTPKCDKIFVNAAVGDYRSIIKKKSIDLCSSPTLPDIKCSTYATYLVYLWGNNNDSRVALHVKEGTVKEFHICYPYTYYNSSLVSIPYYYDLITRGYRALVFSGDLDLEAPFTGTMEWIESFNLSIVEPWRSWHVNGQVGGYTVRYSKNLTFATVKGAGHEAPRDKTAESSAIFYRWISDKPL